MKLAGEHQFTATRMDVWHALQDPQILANALPGVRRLETLSDDRFAVTVTVGVGAVKGAYDGTFSLSDKREPESCTVEAEAGGPPGSVSMKAQMRLREGENGEGAILAYEADAAITGPLAGVGQRMVAAAAKKTTREFLEALDRELTSPAIAPVEAEQATDEGKMVPRVFAPARDVAVAAAKSDIRAFGGGVVLGFALAILGIIIGRRTARR